MDAAGRAGGADGASPPPLAYWHDWPECVILRREAEALIRPRSP